MPKEETSCHLKHALVTNTNPSLSTHTQTDTQTHRQTDRQTHKHTLLYAFGHPAVQTTHSVGVEPSMLHLDGDLLAHAVLLHTAGLSAQAVHPALQTPLQ